MDNNFDIEKYIESIADNKLWKEMPYPPNSVMPSRGRRNMHLQADNDRAWRLFMEDRARELQALEANGGGDTDDDGEQVVEQVAPGPSTPSLSSAYSSTTDPDIVLTASSTGADTYTFQRSTTSDFSGATTIQDSASNSYTDTSPVAGTYYYRVRATNSDGTSAWSATETVTIVLWYPSQLTQLSNHYDAAKIESQSTGYDSGTGRITELYDQNSSNHLTVSDSTPAVFKGDNINGNTTLRLDVPYDDSTDLDGDANLTEFPDMWSPTGYGPYSKDVDSNTGVDDFGFFIVSRPLDSAESTIYMFTQSPDDDSRHQVQFPGNTSQANGRSMAGPIGPAGNQYNMGLVVPMPSSVMHCMFFESVKSETRQSGRFDFTNIGGGSNYTPPTFTIKNKRFRLGRGNSDFGELITFNSKLTTTDINKVEGYLAHKWGLTGNLPGSHPYKSSAPTMSS